VQTAPILGLKFGNKTLDFYQAQSDCEFLWTSKDAGRDVRLYPYWTRNKFHDTVPKDYVWAIVSDQYTYYSHEHKDAADLNQISDWELWSFKSTMPHTKLHESQALEFVRSDLRLRKYTGSCIWTGTVDIMDEAAYRELNRRTRQRTAMNMFREKLSSDDWFLYDQSDKEGWRTTVQDPAEFREESWIALQ